MYIVSDLAGATTTTALANADAFFFASLFIFNFARLHNSDAFISAGYSEWFVHFARSATERQIAFKLKLIIGQLARTICVVLRISESGQHRGRGEGADGCWLIWRDRADMCGPHLHEAKTL